MKKRRTLKIKITSFVLVAIHLFEVVFPSVSIALTGGPSQPEVQSFEPVGTSEMVDLFSGDFNYNIPLLDVGGYPVNIAYHAGVGMDQEASWTGLGWNINAGVINRDMRGVPDDFNGDVIQKELNIKANNNYTFNVGLPVNDLEIFGVKVLKDEKINLGINYNNYKGVGFNFGFSPSVSIGGANLPGLSAGLGLNYSTSGGFNVSPSLSLQMKLKEMENNNVNYSVTATPNLGSNFNSRYGLQALSYGINYNLSKKVQVDGKEKNASISNKSVSASHSFGIQTYTPSIAFPMASRSLTMSLSFGVDFMGAFPNTNFTGSASTTYLKNKTSSKQAYGYMYEHNHRDVKDMQDHDFLLDFNRENDATFNKKTKNLPLTNHTYDIYSVSGHGVGGSYRAFRNDIGVVGDDFANTTSTGGSFGVELGTGAIAHFGVDVNMSFHSSKSGAWVGDKNKWISNKNSGKFNIARHIFGFRGVDFTRTPADYEPAYFKKAGEMLTVDEDHFSLMKNGNAVTLNPLTLESSPRIELHNKNSKTNKTSKFFKYQNDNNNTIRHERDKRNQVFNYLNTGNRSIAGLTKYVNYDAINPPIFDPYKTSNPTPVRPDHHTSEISIVGEDGMRYYYGIPAYNNVQQEEMFNVAGRAKNNATGQVTYSSSSVVDNSTSNKRGRDHFYSKTTTPDYAHSYLLTGIVSSDYVDLTGDGISNDDYGTSVKINYSKVHSAYRWRVPYNHNSASLSEGIRSLDIDDKGSYVYGEKEIWHISSIESKTHHAFFRISKRHDGLGVLGINGGKDTSLKSYKLDRIELYSKQDIDMYEMNAKPVKVVHFQYDYSLCKSIDNNDNVSNDGGKLTLRKIWFTYGTSHRGRIAPYSFKYAGDDGQPGINPNYNLKGNDAWGNYKEMKTNDNGPTGNLSNSDFPYPDSDKLTTDENSFAWSLTQIDLPSGGKIKVSYEADDYGYVENKRALEMFKIKGFGWESDKINRGHKIFDRNGKDRHTDLLFFELNEPYTGSNPSEYIKKHYLEGLEYLQFNVYAYLKKDKATDDDIYEYVKGYCKIDWEKGCGMSNSTEGWVAIKKMHINDKDDGTDRSMVNPIAKTIWNYTRLYMPHLVYPEPDIKDDEITQIKSLVNVISSDFYRMFRGINKSLEDQNYGHKISADKSWVRLCAPFKKRLGGGHRVKKIEMSDEWQVMAFPSDANATTNYGQEYEYIKTETQTNGEVWTISSGVAGNLPGLMSDEHPLVQPRFSSEDYVLVSDIETYEDRPIGETFFQGANIGYSQVKVTSIVPSDVKRTAAGYTINEFYTAFDYPTIVTATDMIQHHVKPIPFIKRQHKAMVGQGFAIELNDMHGKPKAQYTYAEGKKDPTSWTKSIYQTDSSVYPNRLNNKVLTIAPDKTIIEKEIGVEYDAIIDNRFNEALTYTPGVSYNTEVFSLLIFPIIIPAILPSLSRDETEFKSTVTTKVIKKYGVLSKTIAFQEGSSITTSNLLYDDQTGEVLLTSVQNEYNDNVYSLTYPAHWAYDGMGQAYKNIGLEINGVEIKSDGIVFPHSFVTTDYLLPGDECIVKYPSGEMEMAWVYLGTGNKLNFINESGYPLTNAKNATIRVIRSGRRNMPKSPIATFTTLSNPLVKTGSVYSINIQNVVNTEAIEYKEEWQTHLDLVPMYTCDTVGSDNYRNFVNFIDELPNIQKLVKQKYLISNNFYSKINDTDFFVRVFIKQAGAGVFLPSGTDTCNYGDSIFIAYCWYDSIDQTHCYPLQFAEIVGIQNLIPKPLALHDYKYDHFWAIVSRPSNYPTETFFNTNTKAKPYSDSISKYFFRTCYDNDSIIDYNLDSTNLEIAYHHSSHTYNAKYEIIVRVNSAEFSCECQNMEFIFNKPNRFKTILDYYDYKPREENSITCKVIVEKEDSQLDTLEAIVKSCMPLYVCKYSCGNVTEEKVINPYRANILGNWRPYKSYKYLGERTYQSGSPNSRTDGQYTSFSSFWNYNGTDKKYIKNNSDNKWVNASEITAYTPFGNEVENKDALGNYSAALFGYQNTLTTAVASNCRYNQLAFDGFEDYSVNYGSVYLCNQGHFNFSHEIYMESGIDLDNTYQHSGNFSLKLNAGKEATLDRPINIEMLPLTGVNEAEVKVARLTDDLGVFRPGAGKYVLGAWVRSENKIGDTTYNDGLIEIEIIDEFDVSTFVSVPCVGQIIEGWQRMEAVFELPSNVKSIKIRLMSEETAAVWFDDIRVHTYDGNMKSYVYDSRLLKLRAELDENNYATFYEYDQEGSLIRVKKETVKGIVTLKEVRNHVKGKN